MQRLIWNEKKKSCITKLETYNRVNSFNMHPAFNQQIFHLLGEIYGGKRENFRSVSKHKHTFKMKIHY